MNRRWRILGSVFLLGLIAWRLDWTQVLSTFARMQPLAWLAAVGVYLLTQAISSLRWQLLARPLGFQAPWHQFLRYYFIGMFFNLVLPTSVGGDVVRAWYLAGESSRGRSAAFLSVLADRGGGLAVLVLLACGAALVSPVSLAPWIAWTVAGLGAAACLGGLTFLLMLFPEVADVVSRLGYLGAKLSRVLVLARVYLGRTQLLLGTTLLSVAVQVLNVVLGWLIGLGLGLSIPFSYYAIVVPLVALLTLIPISLNGMGLRELGTVVLLAPLHIHTHEAVALAFLQFAACSAASLVGLVFYLSNRDARGIPGSQPLDGQSGEEHVVLDPIQGGPQGMRPSSPSRVLDRQSPEGMVARGLGLRMDTQGNP